MRNVCYTCFLMRRRITPDEDSLCNNVVTSYKLLDKTVVFSVTLRLIWNSCEKMGQEGKARLIMRKLILKERSNFIQGSITGASTFRPC